MRKIRKSRSLFADNLVSSLPDVITERPFLARPSEPTTICHPVWRLGRGGLERQLVQVVNRLSRDRFRHVVLVRGWNESSEALANELGSHVDLIRQADPERDRTWSRWLAGILREYEVDVLHVRGLSMLMDSVLASEFYGDTAVAFSFHGFESPDNQIVGIRRKIYREAILRCDARWAVGREAADSIANMLYVPGDSFGVIPNGVDTDHYRPAVDRSAIRRTLGLPDDRLVLLSVGNLKPVKGHEILLQAMQRSKAVADRVVLAIVGDDYLDGALQTWTAENLDGFDVRFCGRRTDTLPWYQAADAFVLPSFWEGMSNAMLEAMACGLPVIATQVGGNQDVIPDEQTGLLVEAGQPEALSDAIVRMIDDTSLRIELANASRERVLEHFSLNDTVRAYAEHYRQLVRSDVSELIETQAVEVV